MNPYLVRRVTDPGQAFDQMQAFIDNHPDRLAEFQDVLRDAKRFLERYPERRGTDEGDGLRAYFVYPFTFHFKIDDENNRVDILRVELWKA